jgi:aminopeptidase N
VPERPVLSLNRGFSAPIKVTSNVSAEDLKFLAAHDSDPFNRWQAVQSLANTMLDGQCRGDPRRPRAARGRGLTAALARVMADDARTGLRRADARRMPSEADIARDIGRDVDPDAIFAARARLRATIGRGSGRTARDLSAHAGRRPFSPDARAPAGAR